jgi:hypothetical protein
MSLRTALYPLVLFLSLPVLADQPTEAEIAAQIKAGEKAQLDLRSIQRYGDIQGRFEVVIAAAEPDAKAEDGAAARRVRYMVNCEDGTMTLAAVGVFDANGNVLKSLVAPPRSLDPVKPEKGSEQATWLRRVCMF